MCSLALSEVFCFVFCFLFFCLNLWRRGSLPQRSWRLGAPPFCGEPFLRHRAPLSLLGLDVMSESHCTNPTGGCSFAQNIKKNSLDSEDDFRSGCRNVSHQQQFFSIQSYTHPDDHTIQTTDTPGFKPFTILS